MGPAAAKQLTEQDAIARTLDESAAHFVRLAEKTGQPLLFCAVYRRAARILRERHAPRPPGPDYVESRGEVAEYRVWLEGIEEVLR